MRIIERYVQVLGRLSSKKNSRVYKAVSLCFGAVFFLVLLPGLFFQIGRFMEQQIVITWPRFLEKGIALITIPMGLFFLLWATLAQWMIGQGTPAPNAPTRKLVIVGPYRLCRNPIELGAILYYRGSAHCWDR